MSLSQAHLAPWTLLLTLAACSPAPLHAQVTALPETPMRFERLEGLSHNTVLSITQDRQGFLWIGTSDGLNRYDGYEFVVYRHDRRDATSLYDNTVRQVLEDHRGTLWIRTGAGLDRFDRRTHQFIHYRFQAEAPALDEGSFLTLLEDHRGQLWVGKGNRLYRYDRRADAFDPVHDIPDEAAQEALQSVRLSTDPFWDLYEDGAGMLWFSTRQGRLYKLDPVSAQITSFQTPWKMLDVAYDDQDRLWIMHAEGLGTFDPTTSAFTSLSAVPEGKNASFAPILKDRNGILWLGSGDGLYRYDAAANERLHLPIDPSPGAYLQNSVSALYEDRAGTLWVGTLSGLYSFDRHAKPFSHLGHDPTDPNSLTGNTVMALWEDTDGFLWVGTLGGGLNRVDRKTGTVTGYRRRAGRPGSLCSDLIWTLYEAPTKPGILWVGTDEGLCSLDRRTGRFTVYELPLLPTATAQPPINALQEDRHGRLWVASAIGLYRLNPTTGAFKRYDRFTSDQPAMSGYAQSLYVDRTGFLWIGTFKGGLYRLTTDTTDTDVFTRYPVLEQAHVTTEEGIWVIHKDAGGVLWLGSDRGLTRFDPQTGAVKHYTQRDGLPGSIVYGILEDDAQWLWVSTNAGLARFEDRYPEDPIFRTYDAGDGLKNTEFNRRAAFRNRQGTLFFGGLEGLTSFVPAQIQDNPYVPPVVLTQIQTSNRDTTAMIDPFGLDHLRLSYRDYTVSFEFAALNFTNPAQNRYAYQLEGFDNGWIDAGTQRLVQYTNIPPGVYTFRVKAANNDGVWNEEGVALRLTVTPPFWQTWWFRTLAGVVLLGLVVSLVRYVSTRKLRQQIRELETQQRIQHERERISRDLHDHVGAQVSNIISGIELINLNARAGKTEGLESHLTALDEDARLTMAQLRETIWALHHDAVSLEALGEQLHRYAHAQQRYRDRPALHCVVSGDRRVELSPVQALSLFRIAQEAVTNALKHADADNVYVTVHAADPGRVELTVRDDGTFREPTSGDSLSGFGVKGMQRRTHELGGTFSLCSDDGQGTTVRVTLPVG